jgi:ATP-dependent Lon protease
MNKIHFVNALCFVKDMGVSVEIQGTRIGKGDGNIILTGNVGNLARDSMYVAKTLLGMVNPKAMEYNYHIHFQYLQLNKDGPSWGLACFMLMCLISDTETKYSNKDVSATGELDLRGNVRKVSYLKEKINGISDYVKCDTVLIPKFEEEIKLENKTVHQITNIQELFYK